MPNPYLTEFLRMRGSSRDACSDYRLRDRMVVKYAWAIPNDEAIRACVECSPIVEVGAGTGYWASLIAEAGGKVDSYDIAPPTVRENSYRHATLWHPVLPIDWLKWDKTRRSTLMLCWPPYGSPMAEEALRRFRGDRLIYVGEWNGCTATPRFEAILNRDWERDATVYLPNWGGIHDYLSVWRR